MTIYAILSSISGIHSLCINKYKDFSFDIYIKKSLNFLFEVDIYQMEIKRKAKVFVLFEWWPL